MASVMQLDSPSIQGRFLWSELQIEGEMIKLPSIFRLEADGVENMFCFELTLRCIALHHFKDNWLELDPSYILNVYDSFYPTEAEVRVLYDISNSKQGFFGNEFSVDDKLLRYDDAVEFLHFIGTYDTQPPPTKAHLEQTEHLGDSPLDSPLLALLKSIVRSNCQTPTLTFPTPGFIPLPSTAAKIVAPATPLSLLDPLPPPSVPDLPASER